LKKPKHGISVPVKTAILGGGDMGFPLLFAGVVMKTSNIYNSLIIIAFTAIALFLGSCDPDMVYDKFQKTEKGSWSWDDKKIFKFCLFKLYKR
jgi:hypothetical protein